MKRFFGVMMVASLALTVTSENVKASISQAGVLFLRIAAGARAAGLGESFVALANDATATHWNPAGLGQYPLTSSYFDWTLPVNKPIEKMTLTTNGMPDNNYKRFDIWVWTDNQLLRFNGIEWLSAELYRPSGDESLESIIRKYTRVVDDSLLAIYQSKVVAFNTGFSSADFDSWKKTILAHLPDDYLPAALQKAFDYFEQALNKLQVDLDQVNQCRNQIANALADSTVSKEEADKLGGLLLQAPRKVLPALIRLPYDLVLTAPITALAGEGRNLWVGTDQGLFRYDGTGWRRFGIADSLTSEQIRCLVTAPNKSIWIGTVTGVSKYDGRTMVNYDTVAGLPGKPIVSLAVKGERLAFAATSDDIYRFDNQKWSNRVSYTVRVNDSWERIARDFTGKQDDNSIQKTVAVLKETNNSQDSVLEAGTVLQLPFRVVLESPVTALEIDKYDDLWVGTETGLKRFKEKEFKNFGYEWRTASEGETVTSIATAVLGATDQDRIKRLVAKIVSYNQLQSENLVAGQKIAVYYNILGSRILSIATNGEKILVGTEFGTLVYYNDRWDRYYHSGLEKNGAVAIGAVDGELFFASSNKVTVYAHARREVTLMHVNWLPELADDLFYEYLAYVQHLEGWGTVGANVTFLNLGKNVRTGEGDTTVLGEFSSFDVAFALSYGTRLTDRIAGGLTAKVIYSNLASVGAGKEQGTGRGASVALDGGLLYRPGGQRLTLGLAITNLGPNISYIDADQSDPLPRNAAVGFTYKLFDSPYNRLTLIGEINKELVNLNSPRKVEIEETILNGGVEYWYGSFFALRAGYIYDKAGDVKTPTFGGGLQYANFRFDFSYIPSVGQQPLSNTLRLSMSGRF